MKNFPTAQEAKQKLKEPRELSEKSKARLAQAIESAISE